MPFIFVHLLDVFMLGENSNSSVRTRLDRFEKPAIDHFLHALLMYEGRSAGGPLITAVQCQLRTDCGNSKVKIIFKILK